MPLCAKESLSGPAVIAYADTLIRADFDLDPQADAVICQVDQSRSLKLNDANEIVELVENRKTSSVI
jgi:glucose-1-phosphate thymidylyltransferase